MKKCINCGITIGGSLNTCPLCQNSLTGEESPFLWPPAKKLRTQTFFYKLQLFIVLTAITLSLCLDFLLDVHGNIHWGLISSLWLISLEILITMLITKSFFIVKFLSFGAFHISLMLILTGWYAGFLGLILKIILPIIISILLIVNLIYSLIDKTDNAMVYLLCNIVVGIAPYIVQFLLKGRQFASSAWVICLIVSIVTFISIAIFKGRQTFEEIKKRIHM